MARGFKSEGRTNPEVFERTTREVFDLNLKRNLLDKEPILFEEVHFIKLVYETEKAVRIKVRDLSEIWIPKSVIQNPGFRETNIAILPEWFLESNEMWDLVGEWEYEQELLPRGF